MRIAAGIILVILGVLDLRSLIILLRGLVITFSSIPVSAVPTILLVIVKAPFFITGGIFCLMRKYWRVCLAAASFAVLLSVWNLGGPLLSSNILMSLIPWVMLVATVIAVIFIVCRKKEWQEISDIMDCKVSYDG
jgi:hypothetical protein